MRTKNPNRKPRQAARPARGGPQAAPAGCGAVPGSGPQKRAGAAYPTSEAYLAAHPWKRAQHKPAAPLPVVLSQADQDRAKVLAELGHGPDGTCPAGVDWRKAREPFTVPRVNCAVEALRVAEEAHGAKPTSASKDAVKATGAAVHATLAVAMPTFADRNRNALAPSARAACDCNGRGTDVEARFSPCGWWWCRKSARLKGPQWAELRAALEVLRGEGIDPCGFGVALAAGTYAEHKALAERWTDVKDLDTFVRKNPGVRERFIGNPSVHLLRSMEEAKWAACPLEKKRAPDLTTWRFLWRVQQVRESDRGWWPSPHKATMPTVAAAILVLFGLAGDSTLKAGTHRLEVAWPRARRWQRALKKASAQ